MKKSTAQKESLSRVHFQPDALGTSKAVKFAEVEGLALTAHSQHTIASLKNKGLRGDELRKALTHTFVKATTK